MSLLPQPERLKSSRVTVNVARLFAAAGFFCDARSPNNFGLKEPSNNSSINGHPFDAPINGSKLAFSRYLRLRYLLRIETSANTIRLGTIGTARILALMVKNAIHAMFNVNQLVFA